MNLKYTSETFTVWPPCINIPWKPQVQSMPTSCASASTTSTRETRVLSRVFHSFHMLIAPWHEELSSERNRSASAWPTNTLAASAMIHYGHYYYTLFTWIGCCKCELKITSKQQGARTGNWSFKQHFAHNIICWSISAWSILANPSDEFWQTECHCWAKKRSAKCADCTGRC